MTKNVEARKKLKFAYFVLPHIGGTYTVYKSVRAGLATHDVEVRWLGVGPEALGAIKHAQWIDELCHGTIVGGDKKEDRAQAQSIIHHLEEEGYDGVFVNAACDRVHSNVIRYLDPRILRIMTVHTITIGTYAGAKVLRDHVHSTICVSPRIRDDLVKKYAFPCAHTHLIPNAINISPFVHQERQLTHKNRLNILFLGRILDTDKGVYWLPQIMDLLADCPVQLTIAGDGPDLVELRRRCLHRFIGRVHPDQVPQVLSEHDVFIFPSRFEGLPLSLVEAMAAGCVPVASRIKGVTDFVVSEGKDGLLFDIGNVREAALCVRNLIDNPSQLITLSNAARKSAAGRFELANMAKSYLDVVQHVKDAPREINAPLSMEKWTYPAGLRPGLRTYLPNDIKKWIRLWRERLA